AESALSQVEAEAGETRARLDSLQGRVKALAVNQYVTNGARPPLAFEGDIASVARGRALLRYVVLGDTDAIDGFRAARDDLDLASSALEKRMKVRQDALASFEKQRAGALAELDRLAAAEKTFLARQAASNRAAATAAASRRTSRATGVIASGSWICPVQGPRSFSNDWGQPRSGGRRHQGNDLLSARGTPVVASVSGTVRHHNSGLGGLSYYLAGDDGNTYFGTHLSGYGASGRVAAGTVVGYIGDSGNARGTNHLHFEIHPGGRGPANPYATLRQYC
ncbi:MAG: murein hydrolase activator EnvC family protein, partial [Acidimicrobiales bacterium]